MEMEKETTGKESNFIDNSDETSAKDRSIRLVTKSNETPEGDGFVVHRILSFTVYSKSRSLLTVR